MFALALLIAAAQAPIPQLPAGYVNWTGFRYLAGKPGEIATAVEKKSILPDGIGADADAAVMRVKIFVFTRESRVDRMPNGVLRSSEAYIFANEQTRIERELESAAPRLAARFGSRVSVKFDVESIAEPLDVRPDRSALEAASETIMARVNNGNFEADDRVFRGPYAGVIALHPGRESINRAPFREGATQRTWREIPIFLASADEPQIESEILGAVEALFVQRATDGSPTEYPLRSLQSEISLFAPAATAPWQMSPDAKIARLKELSKIQSAGRQEGVTTPVTGDPVSDATIELVKDGRFGNVLQIAETGRSRNARVPFPKKSKDESLFGPETKSVKITISSSVREPFALSFLSKSPNAGEFCVTLGRAFELKGTGMAVPFKGDGTWQTVAIDLTPVRKAIGDPVQIVLKTPPSLLHHAVTGLSASLKIAALEVSDEPGSQSISDDFDPEDPFQQALAVQRFAQTGMASDPLRLALHAGQEIVLLNAIHAFTTIKDPLAVPRLAELTNHIKAAISEAAIDALAFQATDEAVVALRRTVHASALETSRGYAAKRLSELPDQRLNVDVEPLLVCRSGRARRFAVEALKGKDEATSRLRMAFLLCVEPEVKLAVTKSADASFAEVRQKLLWSTVNEPSDAVRRESFFKLWPGPNDPIGNADSLGLKDDSFGVRIAILDRMGGDDRFKNLVTAALADKVPWVRSAAVDSLARMNGVTWESIRILVGERDLDVLRSVALLARKHSVALPSELWDRMATGPDALTQQIIREIKKQ